MSQGKFIVNTPWSISAGPSAGGSTMLATGDIAGPVDIHDLDQVSIDVACTTAGGTATLLVETSIDGVNWVVEATLTNASFSGAGIAVRTTISDSHGMSVPRRYARINQSVATAGGVYIAGHVGVQRGKYV